MKKIIFLISAIAITAFASAQTNYSIDKYHSRLTFSANHYGISFVEGIFKNFDATLVSSKEDFTDAQITLTAQVNSINTEVEDRDNDLKSTNWFDAAKYPTISFVSTSFKNVSGNKYKLTGSITMHGVTKPIEFDVLYNGKAQSPFTKKYLVGFTVTGTLNRNDFGVGKEPIPTGVAYEIGLKANVEFIIN